MADTIVMAENDSVVYDQKEVVANGGSGLNSPWKKPMESPAKSPVMGEKSWPALTHVQKAKTAQAPNTHSQVTEIPDGYKKSNNGGNENSSHKHSQQRYSRGRPNKSQNVGPSFPVPTVNRAAYPPARPFIPQIPGHAYGCHPQPMSAPLLVADNCFGKSGSPSPMKASSSPLHGTDSSQNFQPPAQGNQAVNAPKYSAGRIPNAAEGSVPGGHMYLCFPPQFPVDPKGGVIIQDNMTSRAYMRPAFGRPSWFVRGPALPGPGHLHFRPGPPRSFIRAPFPHGVPPHLVNPWAFGLPPATIALREAIVKQIEYYFSDENLLTDHYLISQMDDKGWVPISVIADFKRLKRLCRDTRFILDALQLSSSVEVQGNQLRKCDNTSKCAKNSPASDVKNNSPSEADSKVDVSSDNHTFERSADNTFEPSDVRNFLLTHSSEDTNSETEGLDTLLCSAANADKMSNVLPSILTA